MLISLQVPATGAVSQERTMAQFSVYFNQGDCLIPAFRVHLTPTPAQNIRLCQVQVRTYRAHDRTDRPTAEKGHLPADELLCQQDTCGVQQVDKVT